MESKSELNGDNISVPRYSVVRPRDLRLSKKHGGSTFSRISSSRASLGASSYSWMEAAEKSDLYPSSDNQSSTTWLERKKVNMVANGDLNLEYDKSLLKRARLVTCTGPINLEHGKCLFQAVFDVVIKRYWGLRVVSVDQNVENYLPFRRNDVIVRVNEEELMTKSGDELLAILFDAFSRTQMVDFSLLKQNDFSTPFPDLNDCRPNDDSSFSRRASSRSAASPVSYIKNLNAFNTRSIGQQITVDLHKHAEGGFGISFATRDSFVNSDDLQPVFVERIMSTGAAIHDGRIQFGDRLLFINGVQVTNFKEAMAALRSVPVGEKATLTFSRQDSVVMTSPSSNASPSDLPTDSTSARASIRTPDLLPNNPLSSTIIFEIPVPHPELESSSLGIRFELWSEPRIVHPHSEYSGGSDVTAPMVGDTDTLEDTFSGLFVKQIASGSPASEECAVGCIRPGDQLIAVNGQSVVGLSFQEISVKLKAAIEKAQERMVRKNKRIYLKLTVNRFFRRASRQESLPKNKSILRPLTDANSERKLPLEWDQSPKKVSLSTPEDRGERGRGVAEDSPPAVPPRRLARTPSVDSRGRWRWSERGSPSPTSLGGGGSDSPARCHSAFTRDGVGRRSVSEKRHAHISASNFVHLTDNVLPLRGKVDDQASRLYSTMPASRKIRQIRRSKQVRSAGPIRPIHQEESESHTGSPAPSKESHPSPRVDSSDVLRTDAEDEVPRLDRSPAPELSRSRLHNRSFRAAVKRATPAPPSPSPSKSGGHGRKQEVSEKPEAPPVPSRRSKAAAPSSDLRRMGNHRTQRHSPTPSPISVSSSTAVVSEELLDVRSSSKKGVRCFPTSQKNCLDEDDPGLDSSISRHSGSSGKPIALTGVRHLPSELRRTPSPVDFNAYAIEQKCESRSRARSNFLEEVETCLPQRRSGRTQEKFPPDESSCTNSDPTATLPRRNVYHSPSAVYLGNGHDSKAGICNNEVSSAPHSSPQRTYKDGGAHRPAVWSNPRTSSVIATVKKKCDSPHTIVRSHSPSVVYLTESRSSAASDRYASHSLNRPSVAKHQADLHHRPSLKVKFDRLDPNSAF